MSNDQFLMADFFEQKIYFTSNEQILHRVTKDYE